MSTVKSLRSMELKAMQTTTRDGITEMLLGAMLLFFGALFFLETALVAFGALLPLALNPFGKFLKRRFVYPRVGYAKVARTPHAFRGIGLAAILFVVLIMAALGLFALVLGLDAGYALWLSHFIPAIAGLLMAIGPWVIARTYKLARWYVFAGLFVLAGICLPVFHLAFGYSAVALESAVVGGLALLYGVILFATFLRKYPREEGVHVSD